MMARLGNIILILRYHSALPLQPYRPIILFCTPGHSYFSHINKNHSMITHLGQPRSKRKHSNTYHLLSFHRFFPLTTHSLPGSRHAMRLKEQHNPARLHPLLLLATTAALLSQVQAQTDGWLNITIIHTNDIHSRVDPANALGTACTAANIAVGNCYGGFARTQDFDSET